MKALFTLFISLLAIPFLSLKAQNVWVGGFEPEISYTQSFSNGWKLNGKVLSDIYLFQTKAGNQSGSEGGTEVDKLEFSLSAAKRLSPFLTLGAGYLYGNPTFFGIPEDYEHRLVQQVAISQLMGRNRFSQQLRMEERLFDDEMRLRLRLKLALELPLEGMKLDPGEWYFVGANEGLFDLRDKLSRNALYSENRFQASLGKYSLEKQKFEYGVGYHLGVVTVDRDLENYFYIRMAVFLSSN